MRRAAKIFGGFLAGLVAGSVLLDGRVTAMLAPTAIVWDAVGCPPGVYTITSTAWSLNGGGTFQTTLADVRLPAASVTQVFNDLPTGRYSIIATMTNEAGESVDSGSQLLVVTPPSVRAAKQASGAATSMTERPQRAATHARQPSAPARPAPRAVPTPAPGTKSAQVAVEPPAMPLEAIAAVLGDGSDVRQIDLIDVNGDGDVDVLRIEWLTGAVREWRILR